MKDKKEPLKPPQALHKKAQRIYQLLITRYGLPSWRNPLSPLDEMISTILSQNTNDQNRDVAYTSLRRSFPTWEEVRDAPLDRVIASIRSAGLGNQKGARIQAILRQITEERGGLDLSFLSDLTPVEAKHWLLRFKGIGPKTAAIVMQFTLNHPAFPVDTHIYRVSGRLGLRPEKMSVEQTHLWMEKLFLPDQYGMAHLNIIRLGREICRARKPECPHCPLTRLCPYYRELKNQ
jgi:endonuclease-3